MNLWAHRGLSLEYPENTLLSFEKAKDIKGLTGVELDIQLTKDKKIVVCHDEKVDRTTNGEGYIKDFTLDELKKLEIYAGEDRPVLNIPTIDEVLDVLSDRMHEGLMLNIELKNSKIYYDGMEEMIVKKIHDRDLEKQVIYSSFYAKSLEKMHSIDSDAELGILGRKVSDCYYKLKGGCGATALHPLWNAMDMTKEELEGFTVRAWFEGELFPSESVEEKINLLEIEKLGITDVFVNNPDIYLQ